MPPGTLVPRDWVLDQLSDVAPGITGAAVTAAPLASVDLTIRDLGEMFRKQGFSHQDIAQKVKRSMRTVGRYLRGVSPQLRLPTTPKRVDVLTWCSARILGWVVPRWKLNPKEVDIMLKRLRKVIAEKDPLTVQWLAANEKPRLEF